MTRTTTTLTELARLGFADLGAARDALDTMPDGLAPTLALAADPDQALRLLGGFRTTATHTSAMTGSKSVAWHECQPAEASAGCGCPGSARLIPTHTISAGGA